MKMLPVATLAAGGEAGRPMATADHQTPVHAEGLVLPLVRYHPVAWLELSQ